MSFRITNISAAPIRTGTLSLIAGETLIMPRLPEDLDEYVRGRAVEIIDLSNTTRSYDWANGQKVAYDAEVKSTAINAFEVMLIATTACFVTIGNDPTAGDAAGSTYLVAGERLHIQITPTDKVSVIKVADAGSLFIVPVKPLV